ncbi:hypothetical protein [Chromobacterium fluminis]|nr:hypothetical protein [Chromobacterium haemolyticum]
MSAFSVYLVGMLLLVLGVEPYRPWLLRTGGAILVWATLLAMLS